MDDDNGLGIRNWGYYEPTVKGNLGLQLMSTMVDRDTKSFLAGRDSSAAVMMNANGGYHHHRECGVLESSLPMEYVRDGWFSQRDRLLHVLPGNANFPVLSESSGSHGLQMLPQRSSPKEERVVRMDEVGSKREGPLKKRAGGRAPKSPKAKKPKRVVPKDETNSTVQRVKSGKKNMGMSINGIDMDISGITPPVCSCTGTPQQCYRWGCGGWQSACCTTSVSMYPLPSNTKRPGARIAGRKMSQGAFKKVLERLAAEGYNFSNPIDLRTHWAKHGTNKFVTIR